MPFPSAFLPNFFKSRFFIVDFLLFVFLCLKNILTVICGKIATLKNDRTKYFVLFFINFYKIIFLVFFTKNNFV